jgi:hypothetical protein
MFLVDHKELKWFPWFFGGIRFSQIQISYQVGGR